MSFSNVGMHEGMTDGAIDCTAEGSHGGAGQKAGDVCRWWRPLFAVTNAAARSWVFRYAVDGRERYMGLGSANTLNLAEAREKALECRKLRLAGMDPIEHRETQRLQARVNAAKAITFSQCVDAYLESHEPSWRNPK